MSVVRRIRLRDPSFPPLLAAIHDPPPALFVRGSGAIELLSRPSAAVVGARACSSYGRSVARSLARELAAAGLVVVSGMARGIDGDVLAGDVPHLQHLGLGAVLASLVVLLFLGSVRSTFIVAVFSSCSATWSGVAAGFVSRYSAAAPLT